MQDGENMRFSPKMAPSCLKFNFMSFIMVEGSSYNSLEAMKAAIQDLYSSIFSVFEPWRPKVDDLL